VDCGRINRRGRATIEGGIGYGLSAAVHGGVSLREWDRDFNEFRQPRNPEDEMPEVRPDRREPTPPGYRRFRCWWSRRPWLTHSSARGERLRSLVRPWWQWAGLGNHLSEARSTTRPEHQYNPELMHPMPCPPHPIGRRFTTVGSK
jgi:hypothetical protein